MLVRSLVFAGITAALATQVPSLFEKSTTQALVSQPLAANVTLPQNEPVSIDSHGNVQLKVDAQGHYSGDFRINGKPIRGLIDTGATYVAVNESTARRLGFGAADLDYRYSVSTANGETKAAFVKIGRIEIGSIKVRDIDAMVLKDEALSSTLVGMSFLKKLRSYGVEDGALHLVD